MEWLWGFLWFGLAACGVICVKRCGWPSLDEEGMDAVADAVAEKMVEMDKPEADHLKEFLLGHYGRFARLTIKTYVAEQRRWFK